MSREHKYKAWHIEQKQMYWFDLMWGNHGKGDGYIGMVEWGMPRYSASSYSGNQILIDPNNCELMQYTGLKDKNGKEIYEGDIVKWNKRVFDFDATDDRDEVKMRELISFIEYRNCGFWVNEESFGWEGESMWNWDEMEIIGNIYENPELLNQKKKPNSEI